MNPIELYTIDVKKLMQLHGYINVPAAHNKIKALNNRLMMIGKKVHKSTQISLKNYCILYEIPEQYVIDALNNGYKLFLSQKDVAIIENTKPNYRLPYRRTKSMIGKSIMNELCIIDYCELYDVPLEVVLNQLKDGLTIPKKQPNNTSI